MAEEPGQIRSEVNKLLFLCLYDLQRTVMQDWQSLNMTMAQLKVLLTLSFKGATAISKIAEALSISHPTASHLVDRLVQAGYVERVEDTLDRRSTLAQLTESGDTLARRLWQGRVDHLDDALARLDVQDLLALRQGLRALNNIIAFLPGKTPEGQEPEE